MKQLEWYDLVNKSHKQKYEIVYRQFLDYGSHIAKYVCNKHDMSEEYCTMFIASGLFQKFLQLKNKLIIQNGSFYCNVDFEAMRYTFALLRKVQNNLNFKKGGEYTEPKNMLDTWYYLPNVSFVEVKSKLVREPIINTNIIDVVDIITQWENRDARTQARKTRRYYDGEDGTSELDFIKSYYATPEQALLNKCMKERAKRELDFYRLNCKSFNRVIGIAKKDTARTEAEKSCIKDFRKRFKLYHGEQDTTQDYSQFKIK